MLKSKNVDHLALMLCSKQSEVFVCSYKATV